MIKRQEEGIEYFTDLDKERFGMEDNTDLIEAIRDAAPEDKAGTVFRMDRNKRTKRLLRNIETSAGDMERAASENGKRVRRAFEPSTVKTLNLLRKENIMKVVLASAPMFNNISKNLETLKKYLSNHKNADLIVFGEVFLHGFDGLKWNYEEDKEIALKINDAPIKEIRTLAKEYGVAVSFGFFEKNQDDIYTSNLVVNNNGDILDLFRRVSNTWTTGNACKRYRSGEDFHKFEFMGKTILLAICGDLWFDENIKRINEIKADFILRPLYIDYSIEEWEREAMEEYNQQIAQLHAPVLMVNSYMKDGIGAVGGAYLFGNGKVLESLTLGEVGVLSLNLE